MAGGSPKRRLEVVPDVVEPDDLWALDPARFVAARDDLVRHLRRQDRRETADEVASWRRPTPSVWALNTLARTEPVPVRQVLDSSAALAAAVPPGGDALRQAQATHRDAVEDAVTAAVRVSGVDGSTHRGRMRDTLLAAGADESVAVHLRSGTLHRDHDPPGFAAGLGGTPVERGATRRKAAPARRTARPGPGPTAAAPSTRSEVAAARAEQQARRRERARLGRRAEQAARRAGQLEEQAAAAEARALEERRAAIEARREADDAAAELARVDTD